MNSHRALTLLTLTTTAMVGGLAAAGPAFAGGIGDVLSPAFGTNCANHNIGALAAGATTAGTGAADGNLLGLPLGSALNQCGGADLLPKGDDDLVSDLFKDEDLVSGLIELGASGGPGVVNGGGGGSIYDRPLRGAV
ncbi:hypothetical protein [Streptomyces venezuelae]|uniref:hypothetical protein n=1 Tax=Streptomyces venezuelae TaxID=54571 RepID=UPI00365CB309